MLEQNLFELTNPQKSIWALEQFYKNTSVNNIGGTLIIKEKINFNLLEKSINKFIELNDSFNIKLHFSEDSSIKQFFSNYIYQKINLINLNSYNDLLIKEKELIENSFSLLNTHLYKFIMFKFPNGSGGIIMIIHHLIADAFSCNFAANKIAYIYNCLINSKNEFPQFESYKDYILSENNYINSIKFEKDKKYWDKLFSTMPETVSLSTITNKNVDTFEDINSSRETFTVKKELLEKINNFCRFHKVSKYNFFMAIYSLYIGKVNDTNDFVLGTPILNRTNFKEKNTSGMFINTIPFRCTFTSDISFNQYLDNICLQSIHILRHQKYSYEYILNEIRKKMSNVPTLYNILLSYQVGKSTPSETNFNYSVRWTHSSTNSDELDIHIFEYDDTENSLSIAYDYQSKKFVKKDIINLHNRILNIINQVLENAKIKLSNVELITLEEKHFIFNKYNSKSELPIIKTVIDIFEEQVKNNPYDIAISRNGYSINYINFNNMINYTANYLKNMGVSENDKICLFYNNSIELIINIFAILKLSACYIPIDISYPDDRINYILENSNSKFILTNSSNINKLNNFLNKSLIIDLHDIMDNCKDKIFNNLDLKPNLETLAYIIYTSGSTGKPKGVKIAHESLSNYIGWCKDTYVKDDITNFPLYSSISFDLTVTSVFTPLTTGNTLYIYENSNPQLLLKQIIDDKKVQILKLTPAHLSLLQDIASETVITKLIVGGDILSTGTCKKITELFNNNVSIFNEYGPTEATVGCMTYIYSEDDNINYASVPIGIPAINTKILLLNSDLNLIPFGYNGQMYIGGKCLAKGYLNLQEVTNKKFINSPFDNNEKIYSSGDIAKLFDNGIMEYIGRKDFQVKINGYRIEVGEIQSKILAYENIKDCFVNVITMDDSKLLCAYIVSDIDIDVNDLKNFIMNSLPKYMIPKFFIQVESIPLTINGKINKLLLPLPTKNTNIEYIAPATELEQLLYDIFIKILKVEKISVTQNIFDYLVDSLTIIKVQTKLYYLGISLDTQIFYTYPTIRDIANYITHKSDNLSNNLTELENIEIPDIIIPINKINCEYKNILFFGTTGFLGIHILHELLHTTNAHIYCIIREKDNINSIERFKEKYNFYYNDLDFIMDRITPITGDLYEENFNLLDQTYTELSDIIDCVFSSAAIVKHFGDPEIFYKTNVLGTQKIVDFCIKNDLPFNYISTLSISGYGLTKTPDCIFTENDFYIHQEYNDNVYVKSKFQAESIILNACKYQNLKASIYRIGNITNRYSDGLFQQNASENAFLNRISSIINLNCFPEEILNLQVEFTPVDYCAKFIVHLSKNMYNNLNIYHLFNNNLLTFNNFINILKLYGYKLNIISLDNFKDELLNSNINSFGITNYLSIINNKNTSSLIIDNTYTNTLLNKLNFKWPDITFEYIEKIINYLKKYNFIGDTYEK